MIGTWYIAAPKDAAEQRFRTPFAAASALLDTDVFGWFLTPPGTL